MYIYIYIYIYIHTCIHIPILRCVRTHDHHCPWVGTCVGEGNHLPFYWFLVAQCAELTVFIVEGMTALVQPGGWNAFAWLNLYPGLCLGLVVMGLLHLMVTCLVCFHSFLAMSNITTWENMSWHNISYLRSIPPEEGSPFSLSVPRGRGLPADRSAYQITCCEFSSQVCLQRALARRRASPSLTHLKPWPAGIDFSRLLDGHARRAGILCQSGFTHSVIQS